MRYHPPKQRVVADVVAMEAAFDAYERTLHSMGLDWTPIEDVTPAGQRWIDSQGGWDKVCERLKSDTPILENMAEAFKTVSQHGLVRETQILSVGGIQYRVNPMAPEFFPDEPFVLIIGAKPT
jgi:hypothetical protein